MKIHVITDDKGNIVGTVHGVAGQHGDAPATQLQPLPGQTVREIELPKELEGLRDPEQLHRRLKDHAALK